MAELEAAFRPAREAFREIEKRVIGIENLLFADLQLIVFDFRGAIDRIESRTKSFTSIRDNWVDRNGLPSAQVELSEFLENVGDLIGLRVVVFYDSDVELVAESIASSISGSTLDRKLTLGDGRKGSRFGYRANHINFRYDCSHRFESPALHSVGVEVQVRTVFSDAWARHSHKLVYVNFDKPSDTVMRKFAVSAASLEALDRDIDSLRKERFDEPVEAKIQPIEYELNLTDLSQHVANIIGAYVSEEEICDLIRSISGIDGPHGDSKDLIKLREFIELAWEKVDNVDFDKYGFRDPIVKLRMALYHKDKVKYESLVPFHMQGVISDMLEIGRRKKR